MYDVIVVGGGIGGACMGGVLARAGLGVLVLEKEPVFRDRIRAEGTWPWGVVEARRAGLGELLADGCVVTLNGVSRYENGVVAEVEWTAEADGVPMGLGYSHPQFQEAAFNWAAAQGAAMVRPAKAVSFFHNGHPGVTVAHGGSTADFQARLVIGADGKHSAARRWTGGESQSDREHHRMGGVAVAGAAIDRTTDNFMWDACEAVNWFAAGPELTRLYLIMTAGRIRETGVDRSLESVLAYAAPRMPGGSLDHVEQAGPIGYHSCADTWGTVLAGHGVVLVGDAAGSPDPSVGHGTPLLFHDVRLLSDLLLGNDDWDAATAAFAVERERLFAVIREHDRWSLPYFENSERAARLREGNGRARQADPALWGFARMERTGPGALVADEAARSHFFGEDL
ncbi:MAG: FAD-dependent monooxygenase [Thermomicrobiales bacterium]|nr:FAD-dependent monooxygenase [Thermomicrobiales bacterium]